MTDTVLAAVITVLGTGVLSLLGALLLGKLVPASRVERAENAADRWKTAYDDMRRTQEQQARLLDRLQMTAEVTDTVMAALRARADPLAPPYRSASQPAGESE